MKKLTILAMAALIAALMAVGSGLAQASHCNTTVTAPSSIQTAVDAANPGDVVCLSGTFSSGSTVTIGTSGITISEADGATAVLDGGSGPAFRLADGLSNVTIEELEIRNRTGLRGGGIEAWDRTTSNITVRNNYIHDNSYSGVLVGSEGGFIHTNWMVKKNKVDDHGFIGIELTNCQDCTIMQNTVDPSVLGIVVQARNTIGGSVQINGVRVLHNTVDDAVVGVYVLAYEGTTGLPFDSIGASSLLTNVTINNNTLNRSGFVGVWYRGFNDGGTGRNAKINHNNITCTAGTGIEVLETGGPSSRPGTVQNAKVKNNNFSGCSSNLSDPGGVTK